MLTTTTGPRCSHENVFKWHTHTHRHTQAVFYRTELLFSPTHIPHTKIAYALYSTVFIEIMSHTRYCLAEFSVRNLNIYIFFFHFWMSFAMCVPMRSTLHIIHVNVNAQNCSRYNRDETHVANDVDDLSIRLSFNATIISCAEWCVLVMRKCVSEMCAYFWSSARRWNIRLY